MLQLDYRFRLTDQTTVEYVGLDGLAAVVMIYCRVVRCKITDVWEGHIATIFRVE
jgi:hypothetical protein